MSKYKFGDKVHVLKPHWHDETQTGVITASENGLNTVHFNGGKFSCLIPDDYLTPVSAWITVAEHGLIDADGWYWVCIDGSVFHAMSYSGYLTGYKREWHYRDRGGLMNPNNITHYRQFIEPTPPEGVK